jgi:hypothetical protein
MKAIKQLLACSWDFVKEIISKYGADEESLKKAAAEKATDFVNDVAVILPEAIEEIAAMLNEIIPALANNIVSYLMGAADIRKYARLLGGDDSERIKDMKRQSFVASCSFALVWWSHAKLWKTNRAIYRPYAG